MVDLSVTTNFVGVSSALDTLVQKQLPFATAKALTTVVGKIKAAETAALPSVFDTPTPFTMNAVGTSPATKSNPTASVFVKPTQAGYLELEETGGTRTPVGTALIRPANAKLNRYGNLPRNALAALKNNQNVFFGTVKGIGGVWERPTRGARRKGGHGTVGKLNRDLGFLTGLKLLVRFEGSMSYQPKFKFKERAKAVAQAEIGPAFKAALADAIKTAK